MNKVLVATFDSEARAAEGLAEMKDLHRSGDISLYGTAVLAKDAAGKVSLRQAASEGPVGTTFGLLAGSLVGLLAGPVGLAVGASVGGLTGLIRDLNKSGIDAEFVDEVAQALTPGRVALLADIDEGWTAPVDARFAKLGAPVFRRLRHEVIEEQIARESAAFKAEVAQLKDELATAEADSKAAIQGQIDAAKKRAQVMANQAESRMAQIRRDADTRLSALGAQLEQASECQKTKIEKRIADAKADLELRHGKLAEAGRLTREALAL